MNPVRPHPTLTTSQSFSVSVATDRANESALKAIARPSSRMTWYGTNVKVRRKVLMSTRRSAVR